MSEEAEDHEIFDINDFTTASDWERFIVRIEEIINEWKLSNTEIEKDNIDFNSAIWHEKADTIQFADTSFTITRHYCESSVKSQKKPESQKPVIQPSNESDEQKVNVPPQCMAVLLSQFNDFKHNVPPVAEWYGLNDFLIITPTRSGEPITTESKANLLLSSAAIAINNTACVLPIFIQLHTKTRNMFIGICEGSALKTHFQTIHFNYIPTQYTSLSSLLDIFKSKLGVHTVEPSPLIFVSIRFTYLIQDSINNSIVDFQKEPTIEMLSVEDTPSLKELPFGAIQEPIDNLKLSCIWPSFSEDLIVDTDLDPTRSNDWSLALTTNDGVDLEMTLKLNNFLEQLRRTINPSQIVGHAVSDSNDSFRHSLDKMTQPLAFNKTRSITRFVKPVVSKATSKMKQLNTNASELPLENEFLDIIFNYLFPDVEGKSDEAIPSVARIEEMETSASTKKLLQKLSLMKASSNDDKNNGCLLNKLSVCMVITNEKAQFKGMAHLWSQFVLELRCRWESACLITGVPSGAPDLSRSLLHQKLQMLNCCIVKKIERDNYEKKIVEEQSKDNDDSEDEFFDCVEDDAKTTTPEGRLKKCGDLYLLNNPNESLYVPVTQESTPMTEDMLDEHANVLVNLGSSDDAALLRAKIQSASLLSDMESFKAANPGCVLEDFVRWYSPRDWIEVDAEGETKKFELSHRMKIPGNVWVEIWNTAKAVSVRRQKRLFDDTKEAEKIFEWLNSLSIGQIAELLLPTLFYSSILQIINESYGILIGFEDELEKIIDKAVKISRDINKLQEYKDLVNLIQDSEAHLAKMKSLQNKFLVKEYDEASMIELKVFLNTLLKASYHNGEVKIASGARSNIGKMVINLCKKYSESTNADGQESYDNSERSIWSKPVIREYILRSSTPRPAPYSRQSPQRMYCYLASGEFRLAGAFTEDTMFF